MKESEEIERRAAYGSPLHAPGGSPTPWASSRIFLHHPKPPIEPFSGAKKQPTSLVGGERPGGGCWQGTRVPGVVKYNN